MHLVRDALRELLSGTPSTNIMAPADNQTDFQHPQFFITQGEKLTTLLNVVVYESNSATNPDALVDYLELTGILTDLLDEARLYGMLTAEELESRKQEVRKYVDKIRTVQEAVGDWDVRTKMSMPASRKRARSVDLVEETMGAFKRRRETESERDIVADACISSPVVSFLPSIEKSPTPCWWTEPFYD